MPNPAEMVFHSPSDQIVGTPFSVNNSPRFEYPFPSSSSNSNSIESTPTLTERHYSPTHPKLCTADPPMPPSLLKKPKWAVGLLGRKSNISQKYASGGSAGKGKVCDHLSSEHARARRFSVGTPPELYTTPAEGTDSFFSTTSGLNRTTSAQC
ncbi:hypothetical protein E1B28_011645 [Marasmius oreades]|uniref:Uncharacterized protein n=1 Tax=Marasmius oreades TaxID=181124 RepID=A0A9P7RUI1_9AGAR|nr:uncharacterized protein E1B28_011645 [Marasmius oreades]KAG7090024.1 hypothetical protein E1B28_011645 [Marasmius oreades]